MPRGCAMRARYPRPNRGPVLKSIGRRDENLRRSYCGACGTVCGALPGVTGVGCAGGTCTFTCQPKRADCDEESQPEKDDPQCTRGPPSEATPPSGPASGAP